MVLGILWYAVRRLKRGRLREPIPKYDGASRVRAISSLCASGRARNSDACCDAYKAGPEEYMQENRPLVSVVDDDESVRESLPDLLKELGFAVRAFSAAEAFLGSDAVNETKCLILDIAMPGVSGPDLQRELKFRHQQIPIVFITARRDDTVRALMLEQGAVECLFKPFSEAALLDAIQLALKTPE
jgi:CheY-like chemotaxis protein